MGVSRIIDCLYVSSRLKAKDAAAVHSLGVHLVVSMAAERRPPGSLRKLGIAILWLHTFDHPLLPIPIKALNRGVRVALPLVRDGRGVLVYCNAGRHRSVALAAAILVGIGYSADEAMDLIAERRAVADPYARHIERQIREFEVQWQLGKKSLWLDG
jgi:protein-tyrosine phosphatase